MKTPVAYCRDPRHAAPCAHYADKPCQACLDECDARFLRPAIEPPPWWALTATVVILVSAMIIGGASQCANKAPSRRPADACGSRHPVTIGGSIVVGCR